MGVGAVRLLALVGGVLLGLLGCKQPQTVAIASKPGGKEPGDPLFPVHHNFPAWSARGLIAYEDAGIDCVYSEGGYLIDTTLAGLWTVNPSTGEKHRLLASGTMPAWSRDGGKLAVVIGSDIFTMNADGSERRRLTSGGSNLFPSWNMDGTWITHEGGISTSPGVWIMRTDGSDNQVAGNSGGRYPSWSPVEPVILYTGYFGPIPGELCTIDERLGFLNRTRLTTDQADDCEADYSPDGQQIAFSSQWRQGSFNQPGTAADYLPEIWVMNSDGTGIRELTHNGGISPSWSPDGSKIVYVRWDGRINTPENGVLWVTDVATGTETQLTHKWPNRCASPVAPGSWTDVKQMFR